MFIAMKSLSRPRLHPRPKRWVTPVLTALLAVLVGAPVTLGAWHQWVNRDRGIRSVQTGSSPFQREEPAPGVIHLQLRGEGYALGFAEGQALKPEILEIARFLREDVLTKGPIGPFSRDWVLSRAWELDAFLAERFREELRGMSDASGVPYADLLILNTFDDLLHVARCSSAVVLGQGTKPLLHARNLDYSFHQLARVKVILDIETRGTRIRTIGFPGFIGSLTGMSSRGLSLTSHTSPSDRTQIGEPSGLLYRRMLEDGHTLEEMQSILNSAQRTMGNNLALSDASGNRALALEFDAKAVVTRNPDEGRLLVTNHYWSPDLQSHQNQWLWAPASGSQNRVARLAISLPSGSPANSKLLQEALARVANQDTVQSVVMEPLSGRLWMAKRQTAPVAPGAYLELGPAW